MRVDNFTKCARQYLGSVGFIAMFIALLNPISGFGQNDYPCDECSTIPLSSIACGFDDNALTFTEVTLTFDCGPYAFDLDPSDDAATDGDTLTIDLTGQVCLDASGNALTFTSANNPVGDYIHWGMITVPAGAASFNFLINQTGDDIAFAIYHSATAACSVDELAFVTCGVETGTDTLTIATAGMINDIGYYYVGVWDRTADDKLDGNDDPDVDGTATGTSPEIGASVSCPDEPLCNVSIDSVVIVDNFDDTYRAEICFTAVNGQFSVSDPNALTSPPTFFGTSTVSYPDTICMPKCTNPCIAQQDTCITLYYNDDATYSPMVYAISTPSCMSGVVDTFDVSGCFDIWPAPPAVNFTLDCDHACFGDHYNHVTNQVLTNITGLDQIPIPYTLTTLQTCGAISTADTTNLSINYNDIITPGGAGDPAGFRVTRLYCITDAGTLPGSIDDETECCEQVFWVNDPATTGCELSCNDLIQISLDQNCEALVSVDMMLEGNPDDNCVYYLRLEDEAGNEIGNPIGCEYVGQTIQVSVYNGNNSCWGSVIVEDKIKPTIDICAFVDTVGCNANVPFFDPVNSAMASDNCGLPLELVVLADELDDMDCDEAFAATRTFTYVLIDKKGNQSERCTYTVNFERTLVLCDNDLTDNMGVKRPPNWNNAANEMPHLECVDANEDGFLDWDADGDGVVDVSYTGAPTIDGNDIYPEAEGHCEVQATFTDTKIQVGACEDNFKLLRQWTVLDWCNSSQICQFYQIIKVVDNQPPVTTSQITDCFEVEIDNAFSCTTNFEVPAPTVIFECNDYTWTVSYLPSTLVPGFDADPYDRTTCVQPEDFQTDGLFIPTGVTRSSDDDTPITLTGLPLGQTWIRYLVTDECGNVSEGASEIRVIENIPPTPVCDEHTTVTLTNVNKARVWAESFDDGSYDLCGYDVLYEVRRMDEPDSEFKPYIDFGCADIGTGNMIVMRVTDRVGLSNICMVEASVWGQSNLEWESTPQESFTLQCGADTSVAVLGMPVAIDDCGMPSRSYTNSGSLNDCGYGTLTRNWRAQSQDGKKNVTFTQTIVIGSPVTNITPPSGGDQVDHIGCGLDVDLNPDNPTFGRPSYNGSDCSMIAVTYDDQFFHFTEGACLKVVRTWTVIDWCDFNANSSDRWEYVQVIKVYNDVKPAPNGCAEIIEMELVGDCEVGVAIETKFTDDCNTLEEMIVSYSVDGGTRTVGTLFEGTLGYGTHAIIFTAEDRCGNIESCTFDFTLDEDKEPTPYCLGGITTVVMDNGNVEIWAVDFDRNSFDNCPDNTLDFTMRPRGSSETPTASYNFDCEDLGITEVEIHVTDQFDNSDFCITTIKVQSNGTACDSVTGGGAALIAGSVVTEYSEAVVDAMVMLEEMNPGTQTMIATDNSGTYTFNNVATNADYQLSADKNDDYINGVSTLDIVYIQRHILGLQFLDSPYKVIAADANNSESISASDLVVLRKLILGLIDELPNTESWKFVDATQTFSNQYRPWPYTDKIDVTGVQADEIDNNFVALKVGDVTGDAQPNELSSAEVRNNDKLDLYAVNQVFTKGEIVTIPIKVADAAELFGFQTTISFNQDLLSFEGFESNKLELSKNNFGLHLNDRGVVTMSWNENEQIAFDDNEKVLELSFRAVRNGQLNSNLSMTSFLTRSEAYTTDYEVLDLSLTMMDGDGALFEGLQLFQNKPNPFDDKSIIGFNTPMTGTVTLSVFDITGKKVAKISDNYSKGYHELTIDKSTLNGTGLYYYQIELNGERAMKKMILID